MNGTESVEIERALVVEDLPLRAESTIKRIASSWPHLSGIVFDELTNCEVGILIGNDIAEAHWVLDQRLGGKREPFAVKTLLGWMLLGSSRGRQKQNAVCHCIVNQEKDVTHSIRKLYDSEFSDTSTTTASHSLEDKRALAIVRSSVTIIKGHYQLPLPWRNSTPNLPDNFQLARKRLTYLKSKLGRDPELLWKYEQTFRSYMEKGYIERVGGNKAFPVTRHWYLPHHPVVNPRKPEKIRVVFDCAAKCQGVSLNDNLYQGPDLNAKLEFYTYIEHPFDDDNTDAFYRFRRLVQQRLREMQNARTARKAMEIQGFADHDEWKNSSSAIEAIYCPPAKRTAPLLSADGNTPLTEKTQIL
ncbi:hypothetical protein SprV_1002848900 [Sparganum proliferum]